MLLCESLAFDCAAVWRYFWEDMAEMVAEMVGRTPASLAVTELVHFVGRLCSYLVFLPNQEEQRGGAKFQHVGHPDRSTSSDL